MRFILKNKLDSILQYTIGTVLLIVSLVFVLDPANAENFKRLNQPDYLRQILGWTEVSFCILFIWHKTSYVGALGLLIVCAFAAYLHLTAGVKPYGLIGWTVGVLFILYCGREKLSLTKILAKAGLDFEAKNIGSARSVVPNFHLTFDGHLYFRF